MIRKSKPRGKIRKVRSRRSAASKRTRKRRVTTAELVAAGILDLDTTLMHDPEHF